MPMTPTTSSMMPVSASTWKPHGTVNRPAAIQVKAFQTNVSSWCVNAQTKA